MPALLDLFCGQGGAAAGYARAGWTVTGVDVDPAQGRRYPFTFHAGDAIDFLVAHAREFDAIHASPPCQRYSRTKSSTAGRQHRDLVALTRYALRASGLPYIIENVPGAPLLEPVTVCGAALALTYTDAAGRRLVLRRHRLFESNRWLWPTECLCGIYRDRGWRFATITGGGQTDHAGSGVRGGYTPDADTCRALMRMPWASRRGLMQAIPPPYTEYLGEQLLEHLEAAS